MVRAINALPAPLPPSMSSSGVEAIKNAIVKYEEKQVGMAGAGSSSVDDCIDTL